MKGLKGHTLTFCWTKPKFPSRTSSELGFEQIIRVLYGTELSGLTLACRIFKTSWAKSIRWEELKHPFLFETILKAMRPGAAVAEVLTVWRARKEGVTDNGFGRASCISDSGKTRVSSWNRARPKGGI